jgi:hypothetical protein
MKAAGVAVLAWMMAGCGSSNNPGPADGAMSTPSFACDAPASGSGHICSDYYLSDAATVSGLRASCSSDNGTAVGACSHSGAKGGCRTFISGQNGSSGTETTWYYDLTASMVMSNCGSGTFVAP